MDKHKHCWKMSLWWRHGFKSLLIKSHTQFTLTSLLWTHGSTVKYKFLHVLQQETCGSQVRALPHGFRGCWFDPSQVSALRVNGVWKKEWGRSGPPLSPRAMSSSGYAFQPEKKKISCIQFFTFRPFPTYLGYHHLLFKGVTPQKENDGNLHIN